MALVECLAIAGLIVPGTVLLFAVAVLAGSGACLIDLEHVPLKFEVDAILTKEADAGLTGQKRQQRPQCAGREGEQRGAVERFMEVDGHLRAEVARAVLALDPGHARGIAGRRQQRHDLAWPGREVGQAMVGGWWGHDALQCAPIKRPRRSGFRARAARLPHVCRRARCCGC